MLEILWTHTKSINMNADTPSTPPPVGITYTQ